MNSTPSRIIRNYRLQERKEYLEVALGGFSDVIYIEIENCASKFPAHHYSGGNAISWYDKLSGMYIPSPEFRR